MIGTPFLLHSATRVAEADFCSSIEQASLIQGVTWSMSSVWLHWHLKSSSSSQGVDWAASIKHERAHCGTFSWALAKDATARAAIELENFIFLFLIRTGIAKQETKSAFATEATAKIHFIWIKLCSSNE